jgi:hypothetical protein
MGAVDHRSAVRAELVEMLDAALDRGVDTTIRGHLVVNSRLPGPRANLELLDGFADAVAGLVSLPDPPGDELARVLDGWAALSPDDAPVNRPEVFLPCAAVLGFGAAGAARPEWWDHEMAKIRRAAPDPRWRVREAVAMALQRLLAADWPRAVGVLRDWAVDGDPLVVRAAVAGVAEPALLGPPAHAADALAIQEQAVASLAAQPAAERRSERVRVLRQGLAYTVSVAVAATGDFGLLEAMASSGDPDLVWAAKQNLKKSRLRPWPDEVARLRALL